MSGYAPARKDWTGRYAIVQGSRNSRQLQLLDSEITLEGKQVRAQFRADYADVTGGAVEATAVCTVLDEAAKIVLIELSAEESDAMRALDGVWDAEAFNGAVVERIFEGVYELSRSSTR